MHWIFVYLQTLIFQHNQSRNRIKLFHSIQIYFFFFQALNFLVESFGLLNDLFLLLSILDAGYPVFDLHLADVLFDVILPSVLVFLSFG
jgi:cytochrome c oxidase subunit IV